MPGAAGVTPLGVSLGVFLGRINWGGKTPPPPECGSDSPWAGVLERMERGKKRKPAEPPVFLLCLGVHRDVSKQPDMPTATPPRRDGIRKVANAQQTREAGSLKNTYPREVDWWQEMLPRNGWIQRASVFGGEKIWGLRGKQGFAMASTRPKGHTQYKGVLNSAMDLREGKESRIVSKEANRSKVKKKTARK